MYTCVFFMSCIQSGAQTGIDGGVFSFPSLPSPALPSPSLPFLSPFTLLPIFFPSP